MLTSSRLRWLLLTVFFAAPQAALAQDKPLQFSLVPEVSAGASFRVNDAATGYPFRERASLNYRLGLALGIGERVDVGVHYLHTGLGTEMTRNVATESGVESARSLDAAVLDARFYVLRGGWVGLFLGFNVGLGWQHVAHIATTVTQPESSPVFTKRRCEADGSAGLGLGVSLGGIFDLDDNNAFLMTATGSTHRLSSDPLESGGTVCADGAGSSLLILTQIGFLHRFDLGGKSAKKGSP